MKGPALEDANWAPILWLLNLGFLLAVVLQWRLYLHARSRRRTGGGRKVLHEAVSELRAGGAADVARTALAGALVESGSQPGPLMKGPTPENSIIVLARASGEWVDAVRSSLDPRIKQINTFCELMEEGILRPIDLVRESTELHSQLLEELTLLEPFIWYQATLGGRGRWGLRVLQLLEALGRLRAVSPTPELREANTVQVEDLVVRAWSPVSPPHRWFELV
jgi:hypothetical protein